MGDPDPVDRPVHRHPRQGRGVAAIDDGFFDYLAFTRELDGAQIRKLYDHGGPERMLYLTLRTGPFGDQYGKNPGGLTLDMLKSNPNGIDFGPMVPQLPDILATSDKKIRLAPQYLLDDLPRLAARMERPAEPLVLVSRRHLRSNNTWLHNVPALMKGKDRCTLLIHPDGAVRCGIADGDIVTVKSEAGEIKVPVEVTESIRPGVVSMPHGWGDMASRAPACRWPTTRPARTPMCCPRQCFSTSHPATWCSTASRSRSSTIRPDSARRTNSKVP
ncbi:hypothetical protein MMAN_10430 [Mycobacterium mantenii]|uniref:Molybdopterin dinucleotide-binding domain-containing protein n=1 Tax=Mycobacterium mantenii TaxID=560555 RepID=A0ABM7JN00_MYCNT|nr:hypothetical protein MMAN_10430 [Mycobacterium mantenii]